MQQFNHHTIALKITPAQQEVLTTHYDHLLLKLENGRPLTPKLLDYLRQAMREALDAQPKIPGILEAARTQHQLVQLTHEDNTLLNLPWRLAVEEMPYLYLTKGLPSPRQNKQALQNPLPLKVLVMISAPEDTHARLSYEEEEDRIIQAFGPLYEHGQVQLDFTEDGSLQSLKRKLKENHYHILHFSGHGTFQDGQGWLELEDELRMEKQLTSAADFAATLNAKPEHCPALVLLSSCQTAQGQKEETFKGVSNRLLEIGVPAVVAMGLSIIDYFATVFASHLYQQLAEKEPLHRAFQSAVRHTQQEEARLLPKQPPSQWMIPQLYTNGAVSDLVDWKADYRSLTFQNYKFITGKHALLLERHEGYQFLGRRKERKESLPLLADKQPVLLRGQGGVGKTALAEHLVQRLALQDGTVYPFVFDETTARLEDVIKALQDYLRTKHKRLLIGPETKKYSDKAMEQFLYLLQEVLQVCTPCFVFDNLETFQSEPGGTFSPVHSDTKEVIDFLYQNRLCPLLLTGRYPLADFPEAEKIDLNQVRFADFLKKCQQLGLDKSLLEKVPNALKKTAPGSFQELAQQLHQSFGGNYRALEFFDKLYRQHQGQAESTLAALHHYLEQYQGDILHEMSENLVFNQLLALLTEEERRCLGLMYHLRRPVLPLAVAMQEAEVGDEEAALERLVQLTLLERQLEPLDTEQSLVYYYLTPLVRGMLKQVDLERPVFSEEKAGDYYYHVNKTINHRNYGDLQEAWQHYYTAGQKARVNEIGDVLCQYFYVTSQLDLSKFYGTYTEKLLKAATNDSILNNLGLVFSVHGQMEIALNYYEKSLAVKRKKGDVQGRAAVFNNLGMLYQNKSDYKTALSFHKKSMIISKEFGDNRNIGKSLNNISTVYKDLGQYNKALKYLKLSWELQKEVDDAREKAVILNNIGEVYLSQGKYDEALRSLKLSIKIKDKIGDNLAKAPTFNNIGQIYYELGEPDQSLEYFERGLKTCQELGDRQGEGITLHNISQLYEEKGDYNKALKYLEKSLEISQRVGNLSGQAANLNSIGNIYHFQGKSENALEYLNRSLKIRQQIGDQKGKGVSLNNISLIYQDLKSHDKALEYLKESLRISRDLKDRPGEATVLNNISKVYSKIGDLDQAIKYSKQSHEIFKIIGNTRREVAVLNDIWQMYLSKGDLIEAKLFLKKGLKIYQQIGDQSAEATFLIYLADFARSTGNKKQALIYLEQSLEILQKINDINRQMIVLHNIGVLKTECDQWESAILPLWQAYQLKKQQESPDLSSTISYINYVVEKLGEARVQEILQQQNQ